jgi:cytochrome c2
VRSASTIVAAVALALSGGVAAAQDLARGEALFEPCKSCHSLDPAKQGMAGPHLAGLKGRVVGAAEGFDYSPAFKAARAKRVIWDEARLNAYLADPDAMFKGGWMSPQGLDDEADRAAVTAFLMRGR